MKRLLCASLLLVACRQISGIHPILYEAGTGGDSGAGACTNAKTILTSADSLDILGVAGGYAMAATLSSQTSAYANILTCATANAPCTHPPGILALAFTDALESYTASSSLIYYALQTGAATGSIHSVTFDGKTDQVLLANAKSPLWMGSTGTRVFWTSDDLGATPASLHCIGCGSGDQTWISNLGLTYGVLADASTVYVIADDGSANLTDAIYSCSATAACGTTPKQIIKGLTFNAFYATSEIATDGTNLYVTNDQSAIIRIDTSGTQTNVVKGVAAPVITVDPATGDLFYATDDGTIARVKSDGTQPPVTISTCAPNDPNAVAGIAFDTTSVYVIVIPATGDNAIYAIPRN